MAYFESSRLQKAKRDFSSLFISLRNSLFMLNSMVCFHMTIIRINILQGQALVLVLWNIVAHQMHSKTNITAVNIFRFGRRQISTVY